MENGTRERRGSSGWRRTGGGAPLFAVMGLPALLGLACFESEQSAPAPAVAKPPATAENPSAGTTMPPAAPAPAAPAVPAEAPPAPAPRDAALHTGPGDAAKGKQIYAINCTACHNADPAQDGALGPAIAGSSLTLVEARVVHASYPPGYTPKRPTQQMVALPHLAAAVPDLAAYLQSVR